MNKNLIIFISGVVFGAGSATVVLRKHYQKIAQNDISEMKEHYRKKEEKIAQEIGNTKSEEDPVVVLDEKKDSGDENKNEEPNYQDIIQKLNYNEYSNKLEKSTRKKSKIPEPYLITPEQFAEELSWDKVTLTYYDGDDTFANDEMENVVEGEELVGLKNMDSFGKFEDGVLYVRNEKFGADYEVIYENGSFRDTISEGDW